MNNQEFFASTVTHLRKQGRRASNGFSCCYRGPNNTSCAVGCNIPDSMYEPSMETMTVLQLMHNYEQVAELFKDVDPCLLSDLQFMHDTEDTSTWEARFKEIAKDYNLELPQ